MTVHYEQGAALGGLGPVRHGFFGRKGGASLGDFAENNMSVVVGDEPRAVDINRSASAEALGFFRPSLDLL